MKAIRFFKMSVNVYQATRRNTAGDLSLQTREVSSFGLIIFISKIIKDTLLPSNQRFIGITNRSIYRVTCFDQD
jgi:hypothetical protein